jgi:hypothetical protein
MISAATPRAASARTGRRKSSAADAWLSTRRKMRHRIDDDEVDAALLVQAADVFQESTPLRAGWQMGERLREQTDLAAERELLAAIGPHRPLGIPCIYHCPRASRQ